MGLIDCIGKIKDVSPELAKSLSDKIAKFEKEGITGGEAERKAVAEYGDELYNKFSDIKKRTNKLLPKGQKLKVLPKAAQEAVDVSPIHKKYDTQLEKIKSTKPIERVEDFEAELTRLVAPKESAPTVKTEEPKETGFKMEAVKRADAKKLYQEVRRMDEPTDARGLALKYLADGGKINTADLANEVSTNKTRAKLNTGEKNRMSAEAASKDFLHPTAKTIKEVAHQIWDSLPENLQERISDQQIRDELIDAVNSNNNRLDAASKFVDSYNIEKTLTDKEREYFESQVPEEELALMKWLEEESQRDYGDEFITEIINETINIYENDIKAKANESSPRGKEISSKTNSQANSSEQNKGQSKEGDQKLDYIFSGNQKIEGKPYTINEYLSKAEAVLKQLFPDAKFKAHESVVEYSTKEGRSETSFGVYDPKTKTVALNIELIKRHGGEHSIFHEVIHPIINEVIGKDSGALMNLYNQLEKLHTLKEMKGMGKVLGHELVYSNRGGKVQKVEAIVEFLALVADGQIDTSKLSRKARTKIYDWFKNVLKKVGINIKLNTATDLKKLSQSIKQAFEKGDAKPIEDTLGKRKEVTDGESMDSMMGQEFDDKVKEFIKRSPTLESEQLSKSISDIAKIPIEEARQLVSEVRGEQPKPEAAPEPKTESSGGGAKVPPTEQKKTSPYFEQPPFTARIAELERVRAQFDLNETEGTTVTNNEAIQSADRKITEWKEKGVYGQKVNQIIEAAKNGTGNDADQSVLAQHIADLRVAAKSIKDRSSKEYDNALAAIDKSTDALRALRSDAGRLLGRNAQYKPKTIESVLDVELDMLADHTVETLTPKQKEQAEQRFNEINKAYEAEKAAREKAEQEIVKLQEEAKVNEQKKKAAANKGVKKTKEQYQEERKNLKQSIKDKWKNAGNDGTLSSDIPFRKQLAAIAPDVAKLIYSYLEEGTAKTLDEVRVLLKKELEDSGISVDDRAVSGLISGEFNEPKKKTANQLKQEVAGLRTEQKLLLAIDAIESGEIPVSESKKVERNQKLKSLQDKLEDVRKRFKVGRYSDESKFETSIKQMIAANKKAESAAIEKIKNKDYSEEPKSETIAENKILQEKSKDIYEEYLKSVVAKDEALLKYERARVADKMFKMDKMGRFLHSLGIGVTTAKGMVAMSDQSVALVQMLSFTMSHPTQALKFAKEGIKDFANKERFDIGMAKLHNSKFWDVIEKSGLAIYEPRSAKNELRNELYGGEKNLLNKDIIIGKTNWSPGQAFERATNTMLNNARLSLFLSRISEFGEGITFENSPKLYEEAARTANELTGHGKVQKHIQMASPIINHIIWSTKMFASTLNVLGIGDIVRPAESIRGIKRALGYEVKETGNVKGYYTSMTPEQAKFAVKELGRFIGMGILVLGAAKAASLLQGKDKDIDIDIDPRSSTFGSIKTDNKTFSIYGRYGSAVRTIIQASLMVRMINGKKDVLGDKFGDKTNADIVFGSFGRGKMTPLAGGLFDLAFNNRENYYTKEKMTLANTLQQQLIPMSLKDIPKDIARDGAIQGIAESLYKLYGGNVTDKRDFLKKKSTKSTKPPLNPPTPRK